MEIINELEFTSDFWCVALPIILIIIDVATGYINAWKNNDIQSVKMREGLGKKFGEVVICVLGWLMTLAFGIKLASILTALYVSLMETTSIIENLDKLNAPMPKYIKEKVNNMKDELEGKDDIQ